MKFNAVTSNLKIFFGPNIPSVFMDSKYFSQSSSVKSTVKDEKAEVGFILSPFGGGVSFPSLPHPMWYLHSKGAAASVLVLISHFGIA